MNKDLWAGIAAVKDRLKGRPPRLVIFRNCVHMIREIKGYRWGNGDAPVKEDDHAMDELRYYVMSKPQPRRPTKGEETVQERYKNKLIRMRRNM
ncbi:MAG: hypothetical protein J6Y74_01410 [Clostridia bacterium]|nr:hypothetical protein [Clostridia bacterium]